MAWASSHCECAAGVITSPPATANARVIWPQPRWGPPPGRRSRRPRHRWRAHRGPTSDGLPEPPPAGPLPPAAEEPDLHAPTYLHPNCGTERNTLALTRPRSPAHPAPPESPPPTSQYQTPP